MMYANISLHATANAAAMTTKPPRRRLRLQVGTWVQKVSKLNYTHLYELIIWQIKGIIFCTFYDSEFSGGV